MKFEHLVEINDLQNPLAERITRIQLWNGLVLRAESTKLFIPYLDDCIITERGMDGLSRILRYGDLHVADQVQYEFLNFVHYAVDAQGEIPQSSLRMTIEEPESANFFIRFAYDDGQSEAADAENETYNEYRRSAYQEADIDTVKIIREMAESGQLDSLLPQCPSHVLN